jgi:hypothetical protein
VHSIFLLVGIWAAVKAKGLKLPYASAFWLYPLVHIGFLSFFGGILTLKMAVLIEQILIFIMVLWIVSKSRRA